MHQHSGITRKVIFRSRNGWIRRDKRLSIGIPFMLLRPLPRGFSGRIHCRMLGYCVERLQILTMLIRVMRIWISNRLRFPRVRLCERLWSLYWFPVPIREPGGIDDRINSLLRFRPGWIHTRRRRVPNLHWDVKVLLGRKSTRIEGGSHRFRPLETRWRGIKERLTTRIEGGSHRFRPKSSLGPSSPKIPISSLETRWRGIKERLIFNIFLHFLRLGGFERIPCKTPALHHVRLTLNALLILDAGAQNDWFCTVQILVDGDFLTGFVCDKRATWTTTLGRSHGK